MLRFLGFLALLMIVVCFVVGASIAVANEQPAATGQVVDTYEFDGVTPSESELEPEAEPLTDLRDC